MNNTYNISPANYRYWYNDNLINIIHMAGSSQASFDKLTYRLLNYADLSDYSDDYDIISIWTDDSKCILKQQLDKHNIPLINALPVNYDKTQKWYMPNKIEFIINALKKSKKDIVLIIDGYDVLFNSFKDLLPKFKQCGYRILYNATTHNYPKSDIGVIDDIDSHWKYFNAGCCIGYRKDLINFYEEALNYINIDNPLNSEQYILRHVFATHTDTVMFEYNPNIFITTGKVQTLTKDDVNFLFFPYTKKADS